jgi:4-hydroxybenzoyl-CoA thioesterase
MEFTRPILIRFQHCDPAGIVFYPRYFEMCNQMVEDWFSEGLGLGFQRLHQEMGLGVPTVRVECDFARASRIGDELRFTLRLREIGTKSFRVEVTGAAADGERLRARLTLVCVQLGGALRSVEVPAALREPMRKFLTPA